MVMTTPTSRAAARVEPTIDAVLRRKMQRRGAMIHEQPAIDAVSERLREFLSRRIDGEFLIENIGRLAGGASKEQFVFDLDWVRNGHRGRDRMVLRMDPPGSMVETPRLREFEVLKMLDGVVPVPRVFWATEDPAEQEDLRQDRLAGSAGPDRARGSGRCNSVPRISALAQNHRTGDQCERWYLRCLR